MIVDEAALRRLFRGPPPIEPGTAWYCLQANRIRIWWLGDWRQVDDPLVPRRLADEMFEAEAATRSHILDEELGKIAEEFGIERKA